MLLHRSSDPMKKVIVIGSPGAGKSVFSKALADKTGLPLYHLDNLYWRADRTHITRDELTQKLCNIMQSDEWIIDGNYTGTMEMRMKEADTVFFLDFPSEICIDGIKSRVGKPRDDIPWTEDKIDEEFFQFVKAFGEETRPRIERLLSEYHGNIYRFTGRNDADSFIEGL